MSSLALGFGKKLPENDVYNRRQYFKTDKENQICFDSSIGRDSSPKSRLQKFDPILKFNAKYQEESSKDFNIFYYPTENKWMIVEIIPMGNFTPSKKLKLLKKQSCKNITLSQIVKSCEGVWLAKKYTIKGCDRYTRNFLIKEGYTSSDKNKFLFQDTLDLSNLNCQDDESMKNSRLNNVCENLDNVDDFVLHFKGVDADFKGQNLIGSRKFRLYYFSKDRTIKVEMNDTNMESGKYRELIKRGLVPLPENQSSFLSSSMPGGGFNKETYLNVFGDNSNIKSAKILDKSKNLEQVSTLCAKNCFSDQNFILGTIINLWGTKILLKSCDDLTQYYYMQKYGLDYSEKLIAEVDNMFIKCENDLDDENIPSYNGFGSFEDSLQNCKNLVPKPAKKDEKKYLSQSRCGIDGHVLRFRARKVECEANKNFLISIYLEDDTVKLSEIDNSDLRIQTVLERGKILNPEKSSSKFVEYIKPNDFFIKAIIEINKTHYEIIGADEYTYRYIDEHRESMRQYDSTDEDKKVGDFLKVDESISKILKTNSKNEMSFEEFHGLIDFEKKEITYDELYRFFRNFALKSQNENPKQLLESKNSLLLETIAQDLARQRFNRFDDAAKAMTKSSLMTSDGMSGKFLDSMQILTIFKSLKIRTDFSLFERYLENIKEINSSAKIDTEELIRELQERSQNVTKGNFFNGQTARDTLKIKVENLLKELGQ